MCFLSPPMSLSVLSVDEVDDGAGAKEEQCLEEGMVHQVEQSSRECDAAGRHQGFVSVLEPDTEQVCAGTE